MMGDCRTIEKSTGTRGDHLPTKIRRKFLLLASTSAFAQTQVYLLRGWFGVFSTGMDAIAEALRAKGIKAEAIGHLEWKSTAAKIASDRAAGANGPLVLVGHSQGGNNVIDMARELQKQSIPVAEDPSIVHINMDKDAKIQGQIIDAIATLP